AAWASAPADAARAVPGDAEGQGPLAPALPRRTRRGRPATRAGRAVLGLRHPRRAVHGEFFRRDVTLGSRGDRWSPDGTIHLPPEEAMTKNQLRRVAAIGGSLAALAVRGGDRHGPSGPRR